MAVVLEGLEPLEVLLEAPVIVPHHVPQLVAHASVGAHVGGVRRLVRVALVGPGNSINNNRGRPKRRGGRAGGSGGGRRAVALGRHLAPRPLDELKDPRYA